MKKHIIFIFLSIVSIVANAQNKTFTVEDLWKLKRISNSAVSQNEHFLVYQVTTYEVDKNAGTTQTFLMNLNTKSTNEILGLGAYNLVWNNNSLYYLKDENGSTRLHVFDPLSNSSKEIFNFENVAVEGVSISPDGHRMAVLESIKMNETLKDKYPDLPLAKARLEESLMYRHWNQWSSENAPHLFWYEKNASGLYVKKADVMKGENFSSVQPPFGDISSVCWSLDGTVIYYSTKKKAGKEFALSTNSEVYAFRTQDNITTTLSAAHKGYDSNPMLNANGKTLAWLSMEKDGHEADKNNLRIMDLASRQERNLTATFDLSVDQAVWHPTKDIIYFIAATKGTKMVFSVELASGKIEQITNEWCDYVGLVALKDRLILEKQSMLDPTDIWQLETKTKKGTQLTAVNDAFLKQFPKPTVTQKWYTTTDGKKMLTWVILPPNHNEKEKYPALLYCQGGPQSPVSQYFSYRWNFRLMASHGYIIVAPNRRGLPGFGQEWNDAIEKDWGGQAMKDYLVAIDSSVVQVSSIDKDKLGAVGASYGGYSVYYLAGIHDNRFKAFVSHCGLFNLESWYGTTEELFFANSDQGGPYWLPENKELYAKNSPHHMVDKWNTPMLVIHGGKDFRVPESEGMQAFQVLQLKNIPSKYLYFPDEGHWITKPQNGVLWYREYFDWLDSYLKTAK